MKKPALFLALLTLCTVPAWANPPSLYDELSRAKEVKVFVRLPEDSGKTGLNIESFKKAVEDALRARKSIHFTPVFDEAEARLVIESDIKGFVFSLTDPVDMLAGAAMAAMDAAKVEHFASVDARFTIKEGQKTLWNEGVHASLTDPAFTEEEARERIAARAAEVLIKAAFAKKK